MPSPHAPVESPNALLKHLDSLFALAQIVTPTAEEAVELVEATYKRAFRSTADFEDEEQARIWLFRLMTSIRGEADRPPVEFPAPPSDAAYVPDHPGVVDSPTPDVDLAEFRRRLTSEFIDRALPQAFSMLTSEQRMLLMLCDVERLHCRDAGSILGLDPTQACAKLEEARLALTNAVYDGATNLERHLLGPDMTPDWRRTALQRMIQAELVTTPPTLGPSVASLYSETSRRGTPDSMRIPTSDTAHSASIGLTWQSVLKKFSVVTAIILVAGLLGYGFTRMMTREPDRNLISLSARHAESIEPTFQTTSAEQAERYIRDRLNVRVTIPTIDGAMLQGLSIRTIAENASVPVLLFDDIETNKPIAIYVYTYAFLDRHERRLVLERDILRQIEDEGNFDLHDLGREKALVWRNRDDIFVAITDGDAEALRARIAFPS